MTNEFLNALMPKAIPDLFSIWVSSSRPDLTAVDVARIKAEYSIQSMTDPRHILETAQTILLVDWPSPAVPRALLEAGFTVFSYSPGRYSKAEIAPNPPSDVDSGSVFAPKDLGEQGHLVFRRLDGRPAAADIVSVYRPAEEMPGIIAERVLPLHAKVIWLQRPITSSKERTIAEEHGLVLIEGCDIAEMARTLRRPK